MNWKLSVLTIAALFTAACATIHQGEVGKNVDGEKVNGLDVSAAQINDPDKEPFFLSTVTFENTGDSWIRISRVEPLIGKDMAAKISVVVGPDLKDWAMARADREQLDRENQRQTNMIVGATLVGAAAVSSRGSAPPILWAGTYGWVLGDVVATSRDRSRNPQWVPDSHVQTPFAIPGKGFVRKWILFNVPPTVRLSEIPFKITTVDGRETVINVKVAAK